MDKVIPGKLPNLILPSTEVQVKNREYYKLAGPSKLHYMIVIFQTCWAECVHINDQFDITKSKIFPFIMRKTDYIIYVDNKKN